MASAQKRTVEVKDLTATATAAAEIAGGSGVNALKLLSHVQAAQASENSQATTTTRRAQ